MPALSRASVRTFGTCVPAKKKKKKERKQKWQVWGERKDKKQKQIRKEEGFRNAASVHGSSRWQLASVQVKERDEKLGKKRSS